MIRKKLVKGILPIMLALSLSMTTFAAEIPEAPGSLANQTEAANTDKSADLQPEAEDTPKDESPVEDLAGDQTQQDDPEQSTDTKPDAVKPESKNQSNETEAANESKGITAETSLEWTTDDLLIRV